MPILETKGAASAQGFGFTAGFSGPVTYIEDVFSTYLYTGNGATKVITNGIDLAGKGGLVWIKSRSAATDNELFDTLRGSAALNSNNTNANAIPAGGGISAYNSNGFSMGGGVGYNDSGQTYVSWTFQEQAKFFDIVAYTGTGANRTIAHDLGSVPGCIIVKRIDSAGYDWRVYHRNLTSASYAVDINSSSGETIRLTTWNSTDPSNTVFSVGTDTSVNDSGGTYIAYIFAHNAGGFGLTGNDNVISCGPFTTDVSGGATVNLGYEPQLIMLKPINAGGGYWATSDAMRGMSYKTLKALFATTAFAETPYSPALIPTATGFNLLPGLYGGSISFIYIAIRRGPMKVPTTGTSVFEPVATTGTGATTTVSSPNFPVDLAIIRNRPDVQNAKFTDRLRGETLAFVSESSAAEGTDTQGVLGFDLQTGISVGSDTAYNKNATAMINWFFRRAPKFFDEVCYTGTGANTTQAHNLAAVPELLIVKRRDAAADWSVYSSSFANTEYLALNTTAAKATDATYWNSTTPTASVFSLGTSATTNASAGTYDAYLFATCPGVSKVGTYTGTGLGTTVQVDCGFTAGSRFVLIKRSVGGTGSWYVWDSARGIVAGNDPYLLFNSTTGEQTGTDYVDTYSAGFEISSTAPTALNASGSTYIFLAIA